MLWGTDAPVTRDHVLAMHAVPDVTMLWPWMFWGTDKTEEVRGSRVNSGIFGTQSYGSGVHNAGLGMCEKQNRSTMTSVAVFFLPSTTKIQQAPAA